MAIKDWNDDWRIPILNQEMPTRMEEKEGKEQTLAEEIAVPNKPRSGQNKVQQNKGGVSKKDTHARKKNNTQAPQVQEKQTKTSQGTTSSALRKSKDIIRGQVYKRGVRARNIRHKGCHMNTRSRRMMQTLWPKCSRISHWRILTTLNAKGTILRRSWHTYDNSSSISEKHKRLAVA
jgi:restriction endonuclease